MMLTQCQCLILHILCFFPRDATIFKGLPLCHDNELTKYEIIFVLLNLEAKAEFYSGKKEKKKKRMWGLGYHTLSSFAFCAGALLNSVPVAVYKTDNQ